MCANDDTKSDSSQLIHESSSEQSLSSQLLSHSSSDNVSIFHSPNPRKRKLDLMTESVCCALDRTATTSRNATFIMSAAVHSLSHSLNNTNISRSTIQRRRSKVRQDVSQNLKLNFEPEKVITLHWDSKLLPDVTAQEKVDRLAIIVTGVEVEQLLGVPVLNSGSGQA